MAEKPGQPAPAARSSNGLDPGINAAALREHLQEVVESSAFRGSHRSQQFLRYVVEAAINGHSDRLKERSLGVELFGRPASYDTGEDAIVRVTASDVRRRLHHFYSETASECRIDIPSGGYAPEFRRVAVPPPAGSVSIPGSPAASPQVGANWRRFRNAAIYGVAALGIGAGVWLWSTRMSAKPLSPRTVLPWSTILRRERTIQIVFSDPDISAIQRLLGFRISLPDYANGRYWPVAHPLEGDLQRIFRGVVVPSVDVDIALEVSRLVGPSQRLTTHTARGFRLGNFKTDDDFILLGSPRSNPWSGLFQEQLDFEFADDEGLYAELIRNKRPQPGELQVYVPTAKGWETGQAFATVAFVGNPGQKGQVLLLAGTNAEGTEAAGKLATNLDLLSGILRRYGIDPAGPMGHFELLLQISAMAGSSSEFKVIACHRVKDSPRP